MTHFTIDEFTCKCGCGRNNIDPDFLRMLDIARSIAGVPFIINSGCRCPEHNKAVGSTSDNHIEGHAADIKALNGYMRMRILSGLVKAGFKRIGIHKTFIHADNMDKTESCWVY
ncbi:MAG: D-Ala-D-Ala carboxypeptidase family metallohydrolase [Candidatus Neomarinimicrobiota bacterium]|jgi:hypothetical protein